MVALKVRATGLFSPLFVAEASAIVYSLVETAKANNVEPFAYLCFILDKIRWLGKTPTATELDALLPWNPALRKKLDNSICKKVDAVHASAFFVGRVVVERLLKFFQKNTPYLFFRYEVFFLSSYLNGIVPPGRAAQSLACQHLSQQV